MEEVETAHVKRLPAGGPDCAGERGPCPWSEYGGPPTQELHARMCQRQRCKIPSKADDGERMAQVDGTSYTYVIEASALPVMPRFMPISSRPAMHQRTVSTTAHVGSDHIDEAS